jgi:2-polyprenyl-3-methyl-5-hydroxy-6-metoxy-1,4-benzoquinol methylase
LGIAMSQRAEHPLTPADIAEEVRDFYDRHPYPPPVDSLEKYRRRWQDHQSRHADFHLFWPARAFREDQSILIAGCGTSQGAKHALRWPAARITAIDCSATSVCCTKELQRKHDLQNLEVYQLSIERVSDLGTSFDQIVCTGVLHHLPDPAAGLAALRRVLKTQGAMQLMVYAPYGRAGIYMLQDFCRRVGVQPDDGGIRDLIAALGALPAGHPLQTLLSQAPDFRNEAALADALLHPQDRAYSVPQLFDFLEKGELTFGRWIRQAPYSVRCGVIAKIPQAARVARLSLPEQYAAIELFRGTMVRHSIIAYRNDNQMTQEVSFAGDAWLTYIPIRTPDTICVREKLPPGAAAVLINQAHTYRDLFLPIGPTEKLWFDAIDGVRSIGEIVGTSLPSFSNRTANLDVAGSFFEQLWWHDQVVFKMSQPKQ